MIRDYDENLLLGYVEDDLTEKDRAEVERWIAADPRLANLLEAMRGDRKAIRNLPDPAVPDWLIEDIDQGLERTMLLDDSHVGVGSATQEQKHTARRIFAAVGLAASILLVGSVVILSVTGPIGDRVDFSHNDEVAISEPPPHAAARDNGLGDAKSPAASDREPGPTRDVAGAATLDAGVPSDPANGTPVVAKSDEAIATPINAASPAEAAPEVVSIVVQTRDVDRSVRQLNWVANNIDRAVLEPIGEPLDLNAVGLNTTVVSADVERRVDASEAAGSLAMKGGGSKMAAAESQAERLRAREAYGADAAAVAEDAVHAKATPPPGDGAQSEAQTQADQDRGNSTQYAQGQAPAPMASQQRAVGGPAAAPRLAYNLVVPADQVETAIQLLRDEQQVGDELPYQAVVVNAYIAGDQMAQLREASPALANARRNWPRRTPDYADILRQQLPLRDDVVAQTGVRSANERVIPVIIEQQAEDAVDVQQTPAAAQ